MRVHTRKIENNRFLLSSITSDNRNSQYFFPFWSFRHKFFEQGLMNFSRVYQVFAICTDLKGKNVQQNFAMVLILRQFEAYPQI